MTLNLQLTTFSIDVYVYQLDFVIREGLDYNDDLNDTSSKYYLTSLVNVENAVSCIIIIVS